MTLASLGAPSATAQEEPPEQPPEQPPPPPKVTPEEERIRQEAAALANRGYELFKQGDYNEAISLFEQAEKLSHSPVILSYIAQSYERLGKLIQAQSFYDAIIDEPLGEDAPADFRRAQRRAREQAPLLRRRLPLLRLSISGIDLSRADVELDGKPLDPDTLASPIRVNPGNRTVIVRAPGQPPVVRGFVAAERKTSEIDLVFASGPAPGVVAPPPDPMDWLGPSLAFGTSFAGLVLGVTTGALYLTRSADLKGRCPNDVCTPELEPERDGIQTLGIVSLVGLGVAAAGGATGLALVVSAGGEAPQATFRFGPGAIATTVRF